jgi:hypothetical protein
MLLLSVLEWVADWRVAAWPKEAYQFCFLRRGVKVTEPSSNLIAPL